MKGIREPTVDKPWTVEEMKTVRKRLAMRQTLRILMSAVMGSGLFFNCYSFPSVHPINILAGVICAYFSWKYWMDGSFFGKQIVRLNSHIAEQGG